MRVYSNSETPTRMRQYQWLRKTRFSGTFRSGKTGGSRGLSQWAIHKNIKKKEMRKKIPVGGEEVGARKGLNFRCGKKMSNQRRLWRRGLRDSKQLRYAIREMQLEKYMRGGEYFNHGGYSIENTKTRKTPNGPKNAIPGGAKRGGAEETCGSIDLRR